MTKTNAALFSENMNLAVTHLIGLTNSIVKSDEYPITDLYICDKCGEKLGYQGAVKGNALPNGLHDIEFFAHKPDQIKFVYFGGAQSPMNTTIEAESGTHRFYDHINSIYPTYNRKRKAAQSQKVINALNDDLSRIPYKLDPGIKFGDLSLTEKLKLLINPNKPKTANQFFKPANPSYEWAKNGLIIQATEKIAKHLNNKFCKPDKGITMQLIQYSEEQNFDQRFLKINYFDKVYGDDLCAAYLFLNIRDYIDFTQLFINIQEKYNQKQEIENATIQRKNLKTMLENFKKLPFLKGK